MKTILNKSHLNRCATIMAVVGLSQAAFAGEKTALELAKEGNRYVGEESRDKIVQIRSEKSIATLTPNIWYVVYYDPDAPLKSVEVKFGGGAKLRVARPANILESTAQANKLLPRDKIKIDSNQAIETAVKEPLVANLTLKATKLKLQRWGPDNDQPVWKVRLWAAKLRRPNDSVDIGEVWIDAEEGKVVKNDLHPNRVD